MRVTIHQTLIIEVYGKAITGLGPKRSNKKISSCAVDTDVVALLIPVVQQLRADELRRL